MTETRFQVGDNVSFFVAGRRVEGLVKDVTMIHNEVVYMVESSGCIITIEGRYLHD